MEHFHPVHPILTPPYPRPPERFWYDTEYLQHPEEGIQLISLAIIAEDGREYYAVSRDFDRKAAKADWWIRRNVWPHLAEPHDGEIPWKTREELVEEVYEFVGFPGGVEFWAYNDREDRKLLESILDERPEYKRYYSFVHFEDLEKIERREKDLVPEKPAKPDRHHNALADTRWLRELWNLYAEKLI